MYIICILNVGIALYEYNNIYYNIFSTCNCTLLYLYNR